MASFEDISSYKKLHMNDYIYQFFYFSFLGLVLILIGKSYDLGYFILKILFPYSFLYDNYKFLPIIKPNNKNTPGSSFLTDSLNYSAIQNNNFINNDNNIDQIPKTILQIIE